MKNANAPHLQPPWLVTLEKIVLRKIQLFQNPQNTQKSSIKNPLNVSNLKSVQNSMLTPHNLTTDSVGKKVKGLTYSGECKVMEDPMITHKKTSKDMSKPICVSMV